MVALVVGVRVTTTYRILFAFTVHASKGCKDERKGVHKPFSTILRQL